MRIFVLGAGRMGTAVIQDLLHTRGPNLEIGIGDVDLSRAQDLAKSADEAAQYFKVDVTDVDLLSSMLEKYDAVVNATWYENNLHVMKACFKAGCNYNDLGGLFHMTQKQLLLDGEAKKAGISAIVGGGESPGITNVMSSLAAEEMVKVDSIKIYAGAKETGKSRDLIFPFSISTVIDEYTKKPVEYLDGRYVEVPAMSGEEDAIFPDPVGSNVCHYSIHSEPATLPATIRRGVRSVEFRLGMSEKMMRTLSPLTELGMFSDEQKVSVGGALISPREFMISFFNSRAQSGEQIERWVALKTVVTGATSDGRKIRSVCNLISAPGGYGFKNATAYLTGVAGSVFAQFLSKGRVPEGVIAPETAVDSNEFLHELQTRGIKITREIEYVG